MLFRNYVRSVLSNQSYGPLFDAEKGGGAGTTPSDPPTDPPADPPKDPPTDPPTDEPVTFDDKQQAAVDKIVAKTIAKERKKSETEKAEAEKRATMTADQKAEADRKDREKATTEKEAKANTRIVNLEIKDVAREMGVPSKKLERFLKVVDRDDLEVDSDGNVDQSKVEAAVKAVLADMPEFKGSEHQKGPGGDFSGGDSKPKYSKEQISAMSPKEVAKNWDDINKSLAIHSKAK